MADKPDRDVKLPDPVEMSRMMTHIAEQSQSLVSEFLARQSPMRFGNPDPLNLGQAFFDMTARMMANPAKLMQAQFSLWQDYMALWQSTTRKMLGEPSQPVASPSPEDRRFKDSLWDENFVFDRPFTRFSPPVSSVSRSTSGLVIAKFEGAIASTNWRV